MKSSNFERADGDFFGTDILKGQTTNGVSGLKMREFQIDLLGVKINAMSSFRTGDDII